MSAYLEWLQKQEHKVRRPAKAATPAAETHTESFTSAASRLSSASAAFEVDLAETSDAYRAWRQRRVTTLPTAQPPAAAKNSDEPRAPPTRSTKSVIADAVGKYSLLSKVAADSRKRPLPSTASAGGVATANAAAKSRPPPAATFAPAAASVPLVSSSSAAGAPAVKKIGTAVSRGFVSVRARDSSSAASSRSSSVERNATSHARKRGIDDVEAPSKQASVPAKQQRVNSPATSAATGKRVARCSTNGSLSIAASDDSSDKELDASEGESPEVKPKKRTPLDEALAKIDSKYGSLVSLADLSTRVAHTAYLPDARARSIQEVQFWSDVDRFASL